MTFLVRRPASFTYSGISAPSASFFLRLATVLQPRRERGGGARRREREQRPPRCATLPASVLPRARQRGAGRRRRRGLLPRGAHAAARRRTAALRLQLRHAYAAASAAGEVSSSQSPQAIATRPGSSAIHTASAATAPTTTKKMMTRIICPVSLIRSVARSSVSPRAPPLLARAG